MSTLSIFFRTSSAAAAHGVARAVACRAIDGGGPLVLALTRQRQLLSLTSQLAPACVGRARRAAAPLAPSPLPWCFPRRLLVRPCRLFVSKITVLPKKKPNGPTTLYSTNPARGPELGHTYTANQKKNQDNRGALPPSPPLPSSFFSQTLDAHRGCSITECCTLLTL